MSMKVHSIRIVGNTIVVVNGKTRVFLPPLRRNYKKTSPRADFDAFGKAIVGNLSYSELDEEVLSHKKGHQKDDL